MGLVERIFGTHSERELKRIEPIVNKIESLRGDMQKLTDAELQAKTSEFKDRLSQGETLEDILPEAYAVVREASKRVTGREPYRVQLQSAIILNQGRIAEQKTGEGKALVCQIPAYLNALTGNSVYVVTVNDYLAQRDADDARQTLGWLGLTVGCAVSGMFGRQKKEAYQCDVTYVTNSELGFDFLRDNIASSEEYKVLRGLNYVIIDEVDSVLIDEARTPLIISGPGKPVSKIYELCDKLAKQMVPGELPKEKAKFDYIVDAIKKETEEENGDFIINEKERNVYLTLNGYAKIEKYFHIKNASDPDNSELVHGVLAAIRANYMLTKDKDYVIKDGKVMIVDTFTGRVMDGRRFNDGLHQAIEAKEGVDILSESVTQATITYQNFFNKFKKKCGLTGTALTEETEFREIYGMDVVEIPTNKPVQRIDYQDIVYKTQAGKWRAVVNEIKETYEKGQPVLIGTASVEASEHLSQLLNKEGIPHKVLNAKYHKQEAEIISHAGEKGAVTVATNMAGRGTDIKLGEGVRELGGLKVIGTERHESRRIDNQLRGRSGRQGDPGESIFYVSLEDDLLRVFGAEKMIDMFSMLGFNEDMPIEHAALTSTIEKAQRGIEFTNFTARKNLIQYDQVINEQRDIIYADRDRLLSNDVDLEENIVTMIKKTVANIVDKDMNGDTCEILTPALKKEFCFTFNIGEQVYEEAIASVKQADDEIQKDVVIEKLIETALKVYDLVTGQFPNKSLFINIAKQLLMKNCDTLWQRHIDEMDRLRTYSGLQSYAQKDPLVEYKIEGYNLFSNLINEITQKFIEMIFHLKVEKKSEADARESQHRAEILKAARYINKNTYKGADTPAIPDISNYEILTQYKAS